MRIFVDAMGGDNAPQAPVAGTIEALRRYPGLEITLADAAKIARAYVLRQQTSRGLPHRSAMPTTSGRAPSPGRRLMHPAMATPAISSRRTRHLFILFSDPLDNRKRRGQHYSNFWRKMSP